MAKKKAKAVSKAKPGAKKPVEVKAPVQEKKKGNSGLIMAVVVVIIIGLISLESLMMIKQSAQMAKRPELVTSYKAYYRGVICEVVYNNDFITVDSNNNQIQVQDKTSGVLKGVYTFKGVSPVWVAEAKDGVVYCMLSGTNVIYKIKDYKKVGEVVLSAVKTLSGICINSKDELLAGDNISGKIMKFSLDGQVLGEIGGFGDSKDKVQGSIGRIFTDAKDNVYIMTGNPCGVKVLSSAGKYITDFKLPKPDICGLAQVAVAPDGNIYINDFPESQILVYNQSGKMIGKFSHDVTGNFAITYPPTISGGWDGQIYVCTQSIGVFKPIKY